MRPKPSVSWNPESVSLVLTADNDWKENARGEDYQSRIGAAGRPDVLEYLSAVLAPRVEAVDRDFAEEHGLQRDHGLEHTLRNLHQPQAAPAQAPVRCI